MWKPSAPVCMSIPFGRNAEPRVAGSSCFPSGLCVLPVSPTIGVQEEVYWPCPSHTQNNIPSLVQKRLRSPQPGPALQTSQETVFSLPPPQGGGSHGGDGRSLNTPRILAVLG